MPDVLNVWDDRTEFWVHQLALLVAAHRARQTGVRHTVKRVQVSPGPRGQRWSVTPVQTAPAMAHG